MDFTMKDLDQEIIKFNYDGNFKEDDFYVSKSNKQISTATPVFVFAFFYVCILVMIDSMK